MTRRHRLALAAAVLAATAAACGIPADDDPRAISQEGVPEEVQGDDGATSGGETAIANLYFSSFDGNSDRLVAVERDVPSTAGSSAPTPAIVLESLLDGVQPGEAPADTAADAPLATKIPDGTALREAELAGNGVLSVDLNAAISGVTTPGASLAYGQMVCCGRARGRHERALHRRGLAGGASDRRRRHDEQDGDLRRLRRPARDAPRRLTPAARRTAARGSLPGRTGSRPVTQCGTP
jgi:hypothetical protein